MIIQYVFLSSRNHEFDTAGRRKLKAHRKSGRISSVTQPSRGASGVRAHHKINEEFILFHRRLGYNDQEIDELLKSD